MDSLAANSLQYFPELATIHKTVRPLAKGIKVDFGGF